MANAWTRATVLLTIAERLNALTGLPIDKIDEQLSLDLGLDEAEKAELIMRLEEEFDIEIPDDQFRWENRSGADAHTVKDIVDFIMQALATR